MTNLQRMRKTTVWEVYQKTLEIRSNAIRESLKIPINAIAKELKIEQDIAEECVLILEQLDLVSFDSNSKEITLP